MASSCLAARVMRACALVRHYLFRLFQVDVVVFLGCILFSDVSCFSCVLFLVFLVLVCLVSGVSCFYCFLNCVFPVSVFLLIDVMSLFQFKSLIYAGFRFSCQL